MNFYDECLKVAKPLGIDFTKKATTEEINMLANKYCEALDKNDEYNKNIYFAALAIRFRKSMVNLLNNVKKTYSASDFTVIDYESLPSIFLFRLNKACKYRAWQKPKEDGTYLNAQQCINMVINTHFYELTGGIAKFDKKKANLCTARLDETIANTKGDNEMTLLDTLSDDEDPRQNPLGCSVSDIVADFFRINKYDMGIIIAAIGSADCYKYDKKTNKSEFSLFAVRKEIKYLIKERVDDFIAKFKLNESEVELLNKTVTNLSKYNSTQLNTCIQNTLNEAREMYINK